MTTRKHIQEEIFDVDPETLCRLRAWVDRHVCGYQAVSIAKAERDTALNSRHRMSCQAR